MLENRYMSVKETARYLGIGISKAYQLCKTADFPTLKIGQQILVDKQSLDNTWIPNRQKVSLK
ncbi:MAG: helix-turn-helix domain-containing protein [Mogibacterium sp.]|nr:helix-turn-helix domain-containing protein [Mogibacterium sp.]MBR0341933.1 helix-turn-helix domain-containing protein [Oscillospiraceae bacterium]